MNRVKYKFHPSEYELGENEKFYSDMEAKGWRLVKRGGRLSKFIPVEPGRIRYRVEVSAPAFMDEPGLSEGQLAVFEDCGWEHVLSRGFLHIFRAPEGSSAPEFYADPAQQAQTLKKVRRNLWISWGITLLAFALAFWFILLANKSWDKVIGEWFKRFVQAPTGLAMWVAWLLWGVYVQVWSTWKLNRTYRRLKKGVPLDHNPKGKRILHKLVSRGLLFLTGLFLVLLVAQLIGTREEDFPDQPDGPYIMLSDVGWKGERTDFMGRTSEVTHTASLLTDYWETVEYILTPKEENIWMRQYIYRLRFPGMADTLAQSLMGTPILAHGPEAFSPVEIEGFDAVWASNVELVAVRGDMVAYVMFLGQNDNGIDCQAVCTALKEVWGD